MDWSQLLALGAYGAFLWLVVSGFIGMIAVPVFLIGARLSTKEPGVRNAAMREAGLWGAGVSAALGAVLVLGTMAVATGIAFG